MRSRDHRTKRDVAVRRGGIYASKALKEAPYSCQGRNRGEADPNHISKFLLSIFMVSLLLSCPKIGECTN